MMRTLPQAILCLALYAPLAVAAQTVPKPPAAADAASTPASVSPAELERTFFAIIRSGDALKLLSYVPKDGVNLGRDAHHATRDEIEEQFSSHTGLYCKLFDSACLAADRKASGPACSYRELLTQSDKVRTASTETTRNGVRQAIVVAEVHNDRCAGAFLIDFIFNYQHGGWKLFSIP